MDLILGLIQTSSWQESHQLIQNGVCDFIPMLLKTKEREKYLNFTDSYYQFPLVIVTQEKELFIDSLSLLFVNKEFAMIKSFATQKVLKRKYPHLKIEFVNNTEEGMKKVQNSEVYGFISTLPNVAYIIQRDNVLDVKIAGKVGYSLNLRMGSRIDEPDLTYYFAKSDSYSQPF